MCQLQHSIPQLSGKESGGCCEFGTHNAHKKMGTAVLQELDGAEEERDDLEIYSLSQNEFAAGDESDGGIAFSMIPPLEHEEVPLDKGLFLETGMGALCIRRRSCAIRLPLRPDSSGAHVECVE
jgi:hypothetical protein